MKRRVFLGTALAGLPLTGAFAAQPKVSTWDIPTTTLGRTGVKVQIIAQGGARMDLHPDIPAAAAHVRQVYELGLRYFDCARMYWNGQSEEAYGLGLQGVRKEVFLTSKSVGRTAKAAAADLETSLRLLKTDYVDLWQMHDIRTVDEVAGRPEAGRSDGGLRGGEESRQVPVDRVHRALRSRRPRRDVEGVRPLGHGDDAHPPRGSRLPELRANRPSGVRSLAASRTRPSRSSARPICCGP